MLSQKRNPTAEDGGAAENIKAGRAIDKRQNSFPAFQSPAFAAALLVRRYGLTPPLARLVCELARIGGAS